jgi:RNA polymerase sigma-70 factor, ECF subfamily
LSDEVSARLPELADPVAVQHDGMTRQEERQFIERILAGDRRAAEQFIRAHQGSLYSYMLRMSGRPEVAEDIVQDAFVRALTNLSRFDFKFRFSTWLFTIAMQKHKPAYDSDAVSACRSHGLRPEASTETTELVDNAKAALDWALSQLSEDQREIVVLFHQLEWPICQIAEYMDMPEGTVKSHLHRGRRTMRRALLDHSQYSRHVAEVLE